MGQKQADRATLTAYWAANRRLMTVTLLVWALVSFGAILCVERLNAIVLFGFPLGYYLGAQGALVVFVALIFTHTARMNALDRAHGLQEDEEGAGR